MNPNYLDEYLRKYTDKEITNLDKISRNIDPAVNTADPEIQSYIKMASSGVSAEDLPKTTDETGFAFLTKFMHEVFYLDGILVSKQDRFAPVPLHSHDWLELVYMYSGNCTFHFNIPQTQSLTLEKGQCLLINSKTEHACISCGENDILINFLIRRDFLNVNFFSRFSDDTYLSRFFIQTLYEKTNVEPFIHFCSEKSRRLSIYIQEFLCEYYDKSLNSSDYLNSYTTLIFLELANVYKNNLNNKNQNTKKQYLFPLLRYIEENFTTCTLVSTADFFGMNPSYLSRYIKKHTGVTFMDLIQNQKLMLAEKLLKNTDLPVSEISVQAGYENVTFFYKKFHEKYGCSPAEYRQTPSK